MKTTHDKIRSLTRWRLLLLFATLIPQPTTVFAQTTAFTYQGQLTENGSPANGTYDLTFTLYSASSGGSLIAGPVTNSPVAVSGGLFTVTLDFGNQFPGADRWLEIASRTNGVGTFAPLTPRQQITSTPYAIKALSAASASTNSGTMTASQLSGTLVAAQIPALDAAKITTGTIPDARIDSALARDAEMAAAYQPLNADLTDLADGSLTGSKVGSGINAANVTAGTLLDAQLSANVALLNRNPQTFPGTNIFSARVGIGESSPLAQAHIQGSDIGLTAAGVASIDTVVVEATDAVLGLFSDNSGGYGSGIALKEVVGGVYSNAWGIVRRTSQNAAELRFMFGTNVNITGGTPLMILGTTGSLTVNGNATVDSLTVGSGTPVTKVLSTTATLNFLSTPAQSSSDTTVTLTGAVAGDAVFLGVPGTAVVAGTSYSAWVSAANTVTVRFLNATSSSLDPGAGTFRVAVVQF